MGHWSQYAECHLVVKLNIAGDPVMTSTISVNDNYLNSYVRGTRYLLCEDDISYHGVVYYTVEKYIAVSIFYM